MAPVNTLIRAPVEATQDALMDQIIDMANPICRAHWCGHFCCSDAELANAVRVMASEEVGLVGLYLATLPPPRSAPASAPINTSR